MSKILILGNFAMASNQSIGVSVGVHVLPDELQLSNTPVTVAEPRILSRVFA